MAKGRSRTIRATRIEVVDGEGRVRLVLGMVGEGDHAIYGVLVRNEAGRDRAWMVADADTAQVGLDYQGDTAASLTVDYRGRVDLFNRNDYT